jgi:hypothetical protein
MSSKSVENISLESKGAICAALYKVGDEILDHAGELEFLTEAIDKIFYTEKINTCSNAYLVFERLSKSLRDLQERTVDIIRSIEQTPISSEGRRKKHAGVLCDEGSCVPVRD